MSRMKFAAVVALGSSLIAAPAFAQGTTSAPASGAAVGAPTSAGTKAVEDGGAPMKNSGSMMKSGTMTKAPMGSDAKPTASGGESGGMPNNGH